MYFKLVLSTEQKYFSLTLIQFCSNVEKSTLLNDMIGLSFVNTAKLQTESLNNHVYRKKNTEINSTQGCRS